jgi:cytochrome P450
MIQNIFLTQILSNHPAGYLISRIQRQLMAKGTGGSDAMKKLYMPFGKGRHKCAGQAMAMVTMRIIVATLVLKYHVKLAKDTTIADMNWDDHFLIILKRGYFLNLH